jgi:pyrroloquinoline quinone biosynthesis protein E
MTRAESELSTADWVHVFQQAAKLGVLHLHLTGGEPLARADLVELVEAAHQAGLYTNLITSGLGLVEDRLQKLVAAGLDHLQLSFQDSLEDSANWIAGAKAQAHKIALAREVRKHKIAFTVNLVVHRQNLDHLDEMIRFIEDLAPDRMEIANTQYYGWALANRDALLPTREQVERAVAIVAEAEMRLSGRIRIDFIVPDYYAQYPKACMGGWGRRLMLIDPSGKALPCHAAGVIPGLTFDNVRERSLQWLWEESDAFRRFRGEEWMPEPCRSCDRRAEDFGGCRCQAMLLTGDPAATDPTCSKAPSHGLIESIVHAQNESARDVVAPVFASSFVQFQRDAGPLWTYRINPK